ncbi:hypothetical protein E4U52_003877 [Claviceps spartinae]|nr:hypothetical protein E4U52_003877 [Claviceps spartinae]
MFTLEEVHPRGETIPDRQRRAEAAGDTDDRAVSHTVEKVLRLAVISAFGSQYTGDELPVAVPSFSNILAHEGSDEGELADLSCPAQISNTEKQSGLTQTSQFTTALETLDDSLYRHWVSRRDDLVIHIEDEEHTVSMANAKLVRSSGVSS